MAIRLRVRKAEGEYDPGASKFLGAPTVPEHLVDDLAEEVIFLMQIRLEDIKELDAENKLPHEGYLYFFLDVSGSEYSMTPIVKYSPEEPTAIYDGFNSAVPGYEAYVEDYLISFEPCDDGDTGHKLLGIPNDWNYAEEAPELLFQFDPLDGDMGIFDHLDGLIYFFFGKDRKAFTDVRIAEEIS